MLRGLYSAATVLETLSKQQEITALNLANVATPGYRRQTVAFETFDTQFQRAQEVNNRVGHGTAISAIFNNFESGPELHTQNPFDIALQGDAFFVLQGPNGPLYTRSGGLERGPAGELRLRGSYPIRSQGGGNISLPETARTISVDAKGNVSADGAPVGQLDLANFPDKTKLTQVGPTLFAAQADTPAQPAPDAMVVQGYLEGSNIKPAVELISMIAGMRQYEAAQKAMAALNDSVNQHLKASSRG